MEEVTINITEEVEEVTINVFEGGVIPTASSIIVSDPVTPDYTAPKVGDTMQDVTNKVAGLQENILVDYTLTENAASVTFELDKPIMNHIVVFSGTLCAVDGTPNPGRLFYYINNVNSGWYRYNVLQNIGIEHQTANKTNINAFWQTIISNIIQGFVSSYSDGENTATYPINYYNISNVDSVFSITLGSRLSPLIKAGSNFKIYKL